MFKSYSEIFDQRGEAYHQAMKLNPDARNIEFAIVLEQAKLTDGMLICKNWAWSCNATLFENQDVSTLRPM